MKNKTAATALTFVSLLFLNNLAQSKFLALSILNIIEMFDADDYSLPWH